jgi:hypothetical protein
MKLIIKVGDFVELAKKVERRPSKRWGSSPSR